jgi:hypothetical protein
MFAVTLKIPFCIFNVEKKADFPVSVGGHTGKLLRSLDLTNAI